MAREVKSKRSWSRDVKLAIEIYGEEHVAKKLHVDAGVLVNWLRGKSVPLPGSTIPTRLATLLHE